MQILQCSVISTVKYQIIQFAPFKNAVKYTVKYIHEHIRIATCLQLSRNVLAPTYVAVTKQDIDIT